MEFSTICNVTTGLVNTTTLLIISSTILTSLNSWAGRTSESVPLKLTPSVTKTTTFCAVSRFAELSKSLASSITVSITVEPAVNCKPLICVLIPDRDVVTLSLKLDARLLIRSSKAKTMTRAPDVLEILMLSTNVDRNVCSCVNWLSSMLPDTSAAIIMSNFLLHKFAGKGKERMNQS